MTTSRFIHGTVCLVLLGAGLAPVDGVTAQTVAAAALLVALAIELATQRRPPSLKAAWIVGYLAIVSREAIWGGDEAASLAGVEYYDLACRYVAAAAGAILLGHLMTSSGERASPVRETRLASNPAAIAFVLGLGGLFLALQWPKLGVMVDEGRIGRFGSTTELPLKSLTTVLLGGVLQTGGIVMPAMIAYLSTRIYHWPKSVPFLLAAPVLGALFLLGARYPLLFAAAGFVLVMLPKKAGGARSGLQLAMLGAALFFAFVLMARVRSEGYYQLGQDDALRIGEGPLLHHEGCIAWLAFLIRYVDVHGLLWGRSISGILLFWVPRTLWPGKSTLIGYWLPRTLGDTLSGGHSVSVTFSGDAFADFGFGGGLLVCFLVGLAFGRLEQWTRAQFNESWDHPNVIVAAVLYGAVVFSVRSIDTSLISMTGVILAAYLLRRLVASRAAPAALAGASSERPLVRP